MVSKTDSVTIESSINLNELLWFDKSPTLLLVVDDINSRDSTSVEDPDVVFNINTPNNTFFSSRDVSHPTNLLVLFPAGADNLTFLSIETHSSEDFIEHGNGIKLVVTGVHLLEVV
jgi:hypothetical protein